jgi:imidazole glycerol-phosphate synthase subunit HisH
MKKVAVIDYGMGNLHSVCKAFEFVGAETQIIDRPVDSDQIDRLVLPGVGSLGDCMLGLQTRQFTDWVKSWIAEDRPFLGICLGFQALFDYSEENNAKGLGIFPGKVVRFNLPHEFKIPHIGWNAVGFETLDNAMDEGLGGENNQFYFDHSYYVVPEDGGSIWGRTSHGHEFVSAVSRGNCFAVQFHPEKSQAIGLQIYQNFLRM